MSLVALDIAIVWMSTIAAYFLRFFGVIPANFLQNVVPLALVGSVLFPVLFYLLGLYHFVSRHAGIDVAIRVAAGAVSGFFLMAVVDVFSVQPGQVRPVPVGTLLIMSSFVFIGCSSVRFYARFFAYFQGQSGGRRNVLIIGAGDTGTLLARDISAHPDLGIRAIGFLDDEPLLRNQFVAGVKVLGTTEDLPDVVKRARVDEVLIAVLGATSSQKRRILDLCSAAGVKARVVPHMPGASQPGVADLRTVEIEDLLGREPIPVDIDSIRKTIQGKVVVVTGAAGSIGSELCRQIARLNPRRIVLIEIDETRLYEMYLELLEMKCTEPVMEICDIRDDHKLTDIFLRERPQVVLHAAAYKHVPLMEIAPDEAVKTNVGGTRNVIEASIASQVERFVLISTDKAVQPTTVMGLTKAIAELLMLDACRRGLNANAVRFGNVIGSRGSVIPLFEEQLRRGGPLKVTHPDVTRFFMTIPEAALLVLQAQAVSEGGDIFVLEMGEPVRIVDVAEKMIILSGMDVEIEFTGLRSAEKLHEVLVNEQEELLPTSASKVDRAGALRLPSPELDLAVNTLGMFARINDRSGIKHALAAIMPQFVGDEEGKVNIEEISSEQSAIDSEMETLF